MKSSVKRKMDNHNSRGGRNNFVRNGEGSSSVRLRRRKDVTQSANQATQQQQQQQQQRLFSQKRLASCPAKGEKLLFDFCYCD